MKNCLQKLGLVLVLAGVSMSLGGCEEAFKDVKLPSLADAPEKLGAPKE